MKGTKYQFQMASEFDEMTGVEVVRLTDNKGIYDSILLHRSLVRMENIRYLFLILRELQR